MEFSIVIPSLAYPPANQMWSVPFVSVAKLRRAVVNGRPVDQLLVPGLYMSTSLDGLGRVRPPPMTYISPLKVRARVSPVGRGMLAMVIMESPTGSYLNESAASVIAPPLIEAPPPV